MSSYVTNLFSFSRNLPPPYDKLTSKKVSVASKYGDGKEATLSASVIKAVHAICGCMNGNDGAVGTQDNKSMAEYKSSVNADAYHLVVYNKDSGTIMASVYDKNTETVENYVLNAAGRDGAAIVMALHPTLMEDMEYRTKFYEYYAEFQSGFPDQTKMLNLMGCICDNVYRRAKDESCDAHVKTSLDKSGNLMRVSKTQLDSGAYTPTKVEAGNFCIFAHSTSNGTIKAAETVIEQSDFVGQFELQPRNLTLEEQALVPKLPEWYIVPEEAVEICKHAQLTTGKATQMRNFLLRGPAGTGKTMCAKAIAAGLNLPYMKYTCSAGTEIFDFIGQILPDSENKSVATNEELQKVEAMGGINYENVAKLLNLPDLEDMEYDPEGTYKILTGIDKKDASVQDCMAVVLDKTISKVQALTKVKNGEKQSGGQTFSYTETDFLRALKNGYVVELQEPTTIMQPGVLVGLNSLLEQEGSITLPTGEIIERHPDAVVVVTTNVDYEGCRGLNQSVVDRMSLIKDIELPTPEVMVQRAMSVTGETDEHQVSQMVNVVNSMAEYCKKNSILDGSVGMRSLIDWIISTQITGDVYKSALSTIISKATTDEDARMALITNTLEQEFLPKTKKSA
ncbi:MAG: AAA family ATPase [Clostridia bacterium]|nr:AAA family ATPase [Clostridia bacterium]MBQ4059926.1 AAA family ATPase [Lachnospiraceae bacterium]